MCNTCPSSSHQLVAASIAFRRARRKFPKNLDLRSRSGYSHKEPKETNPGYVKSGSSRNKQIRNVRSNNLYSPKIWINDSRKTHDEFLRKDIKRRPETSCSCYTCRRILQEDDNERVDLEKLKNEKSSGDAKNDQEIKGNCYSDNVKLSFDRDKKKYRKLDNDEKPSWIYKSNSPVTIKSNDRRSCGRGMPALSSLPPYRTRNMKNDSETQYDLLKSYETLPRGRNDFTRGFYEWENRNHPGLSLKTISRNGVPSGGCSCFEQSSEIASGEESCLRPSFVKAQQLERVYDKNCSKGFSGYVQRGKMYPRDTPLTSTKLRRKENEVAPIDHKDSVMILVEKFRTCAKVKDRDGRNFVGSNEDGLRSLKDNYKMTRYASKKSSDFKKNIQNDFRERISKNHPSVANGTWRYTF